jgi:hypothetical protein
MYWGESVFQDIPRRGSKDTECSVLKMLSWSYCWLAGEAVNTVSSYTTLRTHAETMSDREGEWGLNDRNQWSLASAVLLCAVCSVPEGNA